jgi:hypothetical protein
MAGYGVDFGGSEIKMGWQRLPPPHEFELPYFFSFF